MMNCFHNIIIWCKALIYVGVGMMDFKTNLAKMITELA